MIAVPDGAGGMRHVFRDASALPQRRKGAKRIVPDPIRATGDSAAQQLKLFIERVERMDEEILGAHQDRKDILAEAKAMGFDTKTMLTIIRLRRLDPHMRQEAEALLDTYKASLGLSS